MSLGFVSKQMVIPSHLQLITGKVPSIHISVLFPWCSKYPQVTKDLSNIPVMGMELFV